VKEVEVVSCRMKKTNHNKEKEGLAFLIVAPSIFISLVFSFYSLLSFSFSLLALKAFKKNMSRSNGSNNITTTKTITN
jgi:hypothetical protein